MLTSLVPLTLAVLAAQLPVNPRGGGFGPQLPISPGLQKRQALPLIDVQPAAINFAPTAVGQASVPVPVTVRNVSGELLTITAADFEGPDAANFSTFGLPPGGFKLRRGGSKTFDVACTPSDFGLLDAEFVIDTSTADDAGSVPLSVHAIGQAGQEVRMNVGGATETFGGEPWAADYGSLGGTTASTSDPIAGTTDDALYQSYRESVALRYVLPMPAGTYDVTLHFIEPEHQSAGQRVLTVWMGDGLPDVVGLDLFAVAGHDTAYTLSSQTTVFNGTLDVTVLATQGDAVLSGIEVRSFPIIDVEPPSVDFGAVASGQSLEQVLQLTNFGGAPLQIDQLSIDLGEGDDASSFEVTLDGVTYAGAEQTENFPVDVQLVSMQSTTLSAVFQPSAASLDSAKLVLAGNFGTVDVPLSGLGGHEGHPFLHVVIEGPSVLVDYEGDGTANGFFDGSPSHTHEPGSLLSAFEWFVNDVTRAFGDMASLDLAVGNNTVELEIFDTNDPPESLRQGVDVLVVPANQVPGVLVEYFDFAGGDPQTGLSGGLPLPVHVATAQDLSVVDMGGAIGTSDLTADAL
ncbi:MAG: choice-of-anchor D domain-containing protein, partial [Planctomycetota bacterium]